MRIGVCGTGTVSSWISSILNQLNDKDIILYACTSVDLKQTKEFSIKYKYQIVYDTVEDLLNDKLVDLVYIAVPNDQHYKVIKEALTHHKNVVCEKPFGINSKEVKEVLSIAEKENLFISEALWPLFLPSHKWINDEISKGTLGELKEGHITMLNFVLFLERVRKLETGGGSLMDMGSYSLGFMIIHFGLDIKSIEASLRKLDTGVDAEDLVKATYNNGAVVTIHQSIDTPHEKHEEYGEIIGTKGRAVCDSISNPKKVQIFDLDNNLIKEFNVPKQIENDGMPRVSGYEYEFEAFKEALKDGLKETKEVPHKYMLKIVECMDEIRKQGDIVFPFE